MMPRFGYTKHTPSRGGRGTAHRGDFASHRASKQENTGFYGTAACVLLFSDYQNTWR
jgi:hypothetical protein